MEENERLRKRATEFRHKRQTEDFGVPIMEHDFGHWDDTRVADFASLIRKEAMEECAEIAESEGLM